MPRRYRHLTFEERCQVESPKKSELSRGSIPGAHLRSDCTLTGMRQGVALQIGIGVFSQALKPHKSLPRENRSRSVRQVETHLAMWLLESGNRNIFRPNSVSGV